MDTNNMYVTGVKEPLAVAADAYADSSSLVGHTIELPRAHANFEIPKSTGQWPPVQLKNISPDSTAEELQHAIDWVSDLVGWFHSVDLPQAVSTPGGRGWQARAQVFNIPSRVVGASVLDLGAMEGGDTFCAEDADAHSVTACDVDNYFGYDLGANSAWDFVVKRYLAEKARGPEREWAQVISTTTGIRISWVGQLS